MLSGPGFTAKQNIMMTGICCTPLGEHCKLKREKIKVKKITTSLAICTLLCVSLSAQVIDMHMHSYTEKDFWVGKARNGFESSKTIKEHLEQTVQKMNQHKIEYAASVVPLKV
jgi:hypothetical protein